MPTSKAFINYKKNVVFYFFNSLALRIHFLVMNSKGMQKKQRKKEAEESFVITTTLFQF